MNKLLSVIALMGVIACAPAAAEDITIEMLNKRDDGAKMVYSQEIATIEVGDTVTWVPTNKGHNVEFISLRNTYRAMFWRVVDDELFGF